MKALPPAILVIVAAVVNPLNVTSATDRASQDIFFRYIAPIYGAKHQPITVIIFDDQYLTATGSSWPVPYRTMTKFLQTLYCFEPEAVFFDLIFTHQHSSDRQLEQFVDHLNPGPETTAEIVEACAKIRGDEQGIADTLGPVFIGDLAPQKNFPVADGTVVLDQLHAAGVRRVPTNWVAEEGAYPLVIELDEAAAFEDRTPPAGNDEKPGEGVADDGQDIWREIWPDSIDGKTASAALALYSTLQDDQSLAALTAEEQHKLIVEWGFYPRHLPGEAMTEAEHADDNMLRLRSFPEGCTTRPSWFMAPLTESVWQFLLDTLGFLNRNPEQPRQTCPYSQWVPAEAVLFANDKAQRETLRRLFKERVVMIGADIRGAPDLVQSPVHGQIPGVFLHAMALDNLLELGLEHYWRPMPSLPRMAYLPSFAAQISVGKVVEVSLVFAIFLVSSVVARWRERAGDERRQATFPLVELCGHMALVFGTIVALAVLAIAPFNWLGLFGLAISKDVLQQVKFPKLKTGSIIRLRS